MLAASLGGCKTQDWVEMRKLPRNPLESQLRLLSRTGPKPTARTEQFLRNYDLMEVAAGDPREMLTALQQCVADEPTAQGMYAISELAYIAGVKAKDKKNDELALDMFAASVAHAYMYLLDERFDGSRNPYDPEYRRACDLYNQSLEGTLRIVTERGELRPGYEHTINTGKHKFNVEIVARGRWHTEEFEKILFVSDYDVSGLMNHYQTYGLGVPLIAVRKTQATDSANERYYPPGVSFPITAFLRVHTKADEVGDLARADEAETKTVRHCVLELYDPRESTDVVANDRRVPLESDLSMPLAYFLNQPVFKEKNIATLGFLDPNAGREIQGLYMLEPYDPNKIPVLFVHGLWSSPVTWTDMYNDLRSAPDIGNNYQFWFYFYPTGQPFWASATQLRMDLAETLKTLDPDREAPKLDQMVLVGHSMGGLVSRLQTLDSRDDFWQLVSDQSATELRGSEDNKNAILSTLYFKPNPSVRRVVTIGTPHHGSEFANPITSWGTRLVAQVPNMLVKTKQQLVHDNPTLFSHPEYFQIQTGVDSLAPHNAFFAAMEKCPRAEWVTYHNIVGVLQKEKFLSRVSAKGDGIVPLTSARAEDAISEVVVDADHVSLHSQPKSVREVHRILREHLKEMKETDVFAMASYQESVIQQLGPRREYRLEDHYGPNAGRNLRPLGVIPGFHEYEIQRSAEAPDSREFGRATPPTELPPAKQQTIDIETTSGAAVVNAKDFAGETNGVRAAVNVVPAEDLENDLSSPFPDVVPAAEFVPVP